MTEGAGSPERPGLRSWILLAGVLVIGAGGTVLGLERWRSSIDARWAAHAEALPIGTPRAGVLARLGAPRWTLPAGSPPEAAAGDWAYVLATRGDCGPPPEDALSFVRSRLERGESLLRYRVDFPASRELLLGFDAEDRLSCWVMAER